jgi:hypothetical protein
MMGNRETKQQMLSDVEKPVLKSQIIANNTVKIWYEDGTIAVRLHHTDVVTFLTDGTIQLTTGGWYTPTTRDRINKALCGLHGCHTRPWVYQKNFKWYIDDMGGEESPFYDGMVLDRDMEVIKPKSKDKDKERLLKSINEYCERIKRLKKMPLPSQGDCWDCLMFDKAKLEAGLTPNKDHLLLHIKEGYIHGSLLYNALKWAGYNPEFFLRWVNSCEDNTSLKKNITRSVKRYLKTNLGVPC